MLLGARICGQIVCPKGNTIVLPRQSPSRIFQGLPHPPTGTAKATFLCTVCGSQFPCFPQDFRPYRLEQGNQDRPVPYLWHIAGECVLENCGKLKPIYFAYEANAQESTVRRRVLGLVRKMECAAGHEQDVAFDMSQIEVLPLEKQND